MKIINNTTNNLYYVVTPSGGILSESPVIASGTLNAHNTLEFPLTNAGQNPLVYFKSAMPYSDGYIWVQPANGNSTVTITTEID